MLLRNRLGMLLCSIAITALSLQGCGITGPTVKRKKVKKMDKVGVVSISVNTNVKGANETYTVPKELISAALLLPPKEEVKSFLKSKIDKGVKTYDELIRAMYKYAKGFAESDEVDTDSINVPSRQEFEKIMKKDINPDLQAAEKEMDEGVDVIVNKFYRTFDDLFLEIKTPGNIAGNYPDLRASVQTTHSWLFKEFPKRVPFALVEEQKILGSSKYQQFRPTEGALAELAEANRNVYNMAPGNYNIINSLRALSTDKVKELKNSLPEGTDGMMILKANYRISNIQVVGKSTKEEIKESRNANPRTASVGANPETGKEVRGRMRATLSMTVVDDKGNTVLRARKVAKSDSTFTYVHGEGRFAEDADQAVLQATRKALGELETVY